MCSCDTGYQLVSEKHCAGTDSYICVITNTLIDINECQSSNGGCNQTCVNTISSYVCQCNASYSLNSDNHGCDGMDWYSIINKSLY